jgi:GNAT superfamily N-acetyltransferase
MEAADREIREAGPPDARAIAHVQVASWRAAYRGLLPDPLLEGLSVAGRETLWHGRLADQHARRAGRRVDVALEGTALVGFIAAGPSEDGADGARAGETDAQPGEIHAIYVHPDFWSVGVGRALMASAVAHLAGIGASEALLWVLATNMHARRFYEFAGWSWDGRTRIRPLGDPSGLEVSVEEACYGRRLR